MRYAVCFPFLVLASVACGGTEQPQDNARIGLAAECSAPCKAPELDKRVFLLQSAQGSAPLAGTMTRLTFHDGHVGLRASCNSLDGEFALRDDSLVVTELSSTTIGCDSARHAQDDWLSSFITASPRIDVDGNTLTLSAEDATLVFTDREVADPDRPLLDTTWIIDTFIMNDTAASFPGGSASTIWLTKDGTLRYSTGCGSGHTSYTLSSNTLTLGDVGSNTRDCQQNPAAVEAEKRILSVLRGDDPLTFDIQASRLTLQRGDVGLSAIAQEP